MHAPLKSTPRSAPAFADRTIPPSSTPAGLVVPLSPSDPPPPSNHHPWFVKENHTYIMAQALTLWSSPAAFNRQATCPKVRAAVSQWSY